jgi:phospho-N-acetylmuramoyl-pentapeptide-transferase
MLFNLVQYPAVQNWLEAVGLYRLLQVMNQLEFRAFFAVVLSFTLVLLSAKRTIRWLRRMKVGDAPEFYNAELNRLMESRAGTPTMGGLFLCGSILATILILADLYSHYIHVAIAVLVWLGVLGGFDDWLKLTASRRAPGSREGLHAWEKLLFQLGIGAIAGYFLFTHGSSGEPALQSVNHVLTLPFQRTYSPKTLQLEPDLIFLGLGAFVAVATVLIAATSNAVNLTDGMDGLAGGTMIVASFAMMALCFIAGDVHAAQSLLFPHINGADELMIVTGAMAGACLGFLWFNCSPAQVFMGDTGSLPLGGLLACIAVAIRQEILLLVICGVFYMEMASVIIQVGHFKWTGGRRIFRCSPIHHHFHLGGWSEQQVVTRFWVLAAVFAMVALVSLKLR